MKNKHTIVITNDDGIEKPGIIALETVFGKDNNVFVIAPLLEKSATSHAMTLHKPLRVFQKSNNVFAITGYPVDCINLAIKHIVKNKIDLVISGINNGGNLGNDVFYSGTVSAALEAANFGLKAFSISLVKEKSDSKNLYFEYAAGFAKKIADKILNKKLLDEFVSKKKHVRTKAILNINIPNISESKIKGIRITNLGQKLYSHKVLINKDPHGNKYYWIAGRNLGNIDLKDSDCNAINENYISITPISTDITHYGLIEKLDNFKI